MSTQKNIIIIGTTFSIIILLYIFGLPLLNQTPETDNINDPKDNPLYSNYIFSQNEKTIDIGEQPLWIPTATILEVIKRDNILKEELNKLGYTINYHSFLKGNDVNYFLKTGDLEVGIGGDMPAIRITSEDEIKIISLIQEGSVSIISKEIIEIQQLRGKRIGYALGSNAHFYLLNTLTKNDVDISQVELIQMNVNEMSNAIQNNKIDAFSAWEPTPTIAIKEDSELIRMHTGKSYGFIYIKQDLMENHPEFVKHLLASQIRAISWLKQSDSNLLQASKWALDKLTEISPDYSILSARDIADITKKDIIGIRIHQYPRISYKIIENDNVIQKEFQLLQDLNLINMEIKWDQIKDSFDINILETIISNPNQYRINEDMQI